MDLPPAGLAVATEVHSCDPWEGLPDSSCPAIAERRSQQDLFLVTEKDKFSKTGDSGCRKLECMLGEDVVRAMWEF